MLDWKQTRSLGGQVRRLDMRTASPTYLSEAAGTAIEALATLGEAQSKEIAELKQKIAALEKKLALHT